MVCPGNDVHDKLEPNIQHYDTSTHNAIERC